MTIQKVFEKQYGSEVVSDKEVEDAVAEEQKDMVISTNRSSRKQAESRKGLNSYK